MIVGNRHVGETQPAVVEDPTALASVASIAASRTDRRAALAAFAACICAYRAVDDTSNTIGVDASTVATSTAGGGSGLIDCCCAATRAGLIADDRHAALAYRLRWRTKRHRSRPARLGQVTTHRRHLARRHRPCYRQLVTSLNIACARYRSVDTAATSRPFPLRRRNRRSSCRHCPLYR